MTWTPEDINEVLAIAGVRTPGVIVPEPERVIAGLLMDARKDIAALRDELRKVQARVERAEQRADVLDGVVQERNDALTQIDALQKDVAAANKRAAEAEAIKVTAFTMVRDLEVKLRST